MIYGENYVEVYSPVEAYSVDARNSGIISGGSGGSTIITQGTRFLWVYDPNQNDLGGFTGGSWLIGVGGTPLEDWTLEQVGEYFEAGNTNLDEVFRAWNRYVVENAENDPLIVSRFQEAIVSRGGSFSCWETVVTSQ